MADALAFPVEGGVAVVSPPFKAPEASFAELEKHGKVRALIAPNAYHHMGLHAWKARYPEAPVFAPAQSIARVEKQTKLTGVRPLADAPALLGDRVELVDMPHYKTGEVLVRWRIDGGWAWYVTDVMFNFTELPKGPFGLVMKWTKSGPGLRRNALAGFFMIKDKRALYAWMAEQAEKAPPKLVLACHSASVTLPDPVAGLRAALS
jgi:hypothetical protein